MPNDPVSSPAARPVGGQLTAAISNALVRIHRDYIGRGPTKARTFIRDNTVVVMMEDTLTRSEHSLVADGKQQEVLGTRHSLQFTMRPAIVDAVEELTGRTVVAFMSTNHVEPDLACEILVLDDGGFVTSSELVPENQGSEGE